MGNGAFSFSTAPTSHLPFPSYAMLSSPVTRSSGPARFGRSSKSVSEMLGKLLRFSSADNFYGAPAAYKTILPVTMETEKNNLWLFHKLLVAIITTITITGICTVPDNGQRTFTCITFQLTIGGVTQQQVGCSSAIR